MRFIFFFFFAKHFVWARYGHVTNTSVAQEGPSGEYIFYFSPPCRSITRETRADCAVRGGKDAFSLLTGTFSRTCMLHLRKCMKKELGVLSFIAADRAVNENGCSAAFNTCINCFLFMHCFIIWCTYFTLRARAISKCCYATLIPPPIPPLSCIKHFITSNNKCVCEAGFQGAVLQTHTKTTSEL